MFNLASQYYKIFCCYESTTNFVRVGSFHHGIGYNTKQQEINISRPELIVDLERYDILNINFKLI